MTAVIVIVGILTAMLIRVAIGMIAYAANGGFKKRTPAQLDETVKIVEAKIEAPVSTYVEKTEQRSDIAHEQVQV